MNASQQNPRDERAQLTILIAKTLLPLVCPWDQSETAMWYHYHNTPMFRRTVEEFLQLFLSSPQTVEKIMNDMILMAQFFPVKTKL